MLIDKCIKSIKIIPREGKSRRQLLQLWEPEQRTASATQTKDIEESLRVLEESSTAIVNGMQINEHFVKHHSNHDLAKYVVYAKDKTPEQTCEDVLQQINPTILILF